MPRGGLHTATRLASTAGWVFLAAPAVAATPACATLPNTASLQFAQGDTTNVLRSNVAAVRVEELLDLQLSARAPTITLTLGVQGAASFALVNAGNGEESFLLDGRVEGIDAAIEGFALDRNGDGAFDAAVDLAIASGGATPPVAPGAAVQLLALVRGSARRREWPAPSRRARGDRRGSSGRHDCRPRRRRLRRGDRRHDRERLRQRLARLRRGFGPQPGPAHQVAGDRRPGRRRRAGARRDGDLHDRIPLRRERCRPVGAPRRRHPPPARTMSRAASGWTAPHSPTRPTPTRAASTAPACASRWATSRHRRRAGSNSR